MILGSASIVAVALAAGPAAAQTAPQCTPAALDNSALQAGGVTVSPLAGSRDASPKTQISFLGVPIRELKDLSIVGSRSGSHAGRLEAYSQGDGASFLPARPFSEGELVTVRGEVSVGGAERPLLDRFRVETIDPITRTPSSTHGGSPSEVQSFQSRPDLQPPVVTVTSSSSASAPGDLFLAPYAGPGAAGPMILEPDGALVWFKALPRNTSATDLRVQQYEGKPVLTWWQGDISVHGFGLGEDYIADQTYTDIAHVSAGNGYQADLHEFQLTPVGSALITAYEPIRCDLASVDGPTDGALTDSVLQEIDVRTGLVMYEWTSVDHVALGESFERAARSSPSQPFDFFHLNSINVNRDGTLMISARNTWTVYDLEAASGRILWQLGGRHSSFKETPGTGTAWQHDARQLEGGMISIFDNGASPPVHTRSRGIIVELEPAAKTAAVVGELGHVPPLIAESEGNVEALPGGDWFLGWGQEPYFSEYGPEGQLLFEAHLPKYERSYRDFRFPWSGTPAHAPAFAFKPGAPGAGTVYASWNGATGVSGWRVLAGASAAALAPVAQATRGGFETALGLPAGTGGPFLAVQALGAGGEVLGSSAAVSETGLPGAGG